MFGHFTTLCIKGLNYKMFPQNKSFINSGDTPILDLNISDVGNWRFFRWVLAYLSLANNSFVGIVYPAFHLSAMEHSY